MLSSSNAPLRVAAYCRVSTDKDDQLNSLETQRQFFQEYIARQSSWTCIGIFADEGLSGTSVARRPQFSHMVHLALSGTIDLIITKEVSRFARNTVDTLTITRQLKAGGIGVIFLNDGIDTRDSDGEFRLTIMASVAQEESRKISERTRWGQTQALKRGVVFGNNSIFGYILTGGKLTVHPEQAAVVRMIFDKFIAERKGTHIIARELTEAGIDPPLRSGEAWSATMILRVLRNEKYTGNLLQRKYRTTDYLSHRKILNDGAEEQYLLRNHHEAIVDQETFQQAQDELSRRQALIANRQRFSARYWFSGKIICGDCRRSFAVKTTHRASGTIYRRFVCRGRASLIGANQQRCQMRGINAEIITACARHVVSQLSCDREGIIEQIISDIRQLRQSSAVESTPPTSLTKALQRQTVRKNKALDAYLDGAISKDDLNTLVGRCDDEIQRLSTLLTEQESAEIKLESAMDKFQDLRQLLEQELDGGDCILEEVIERITVHSDHFIIQLHEIPLQVLLRAQGRGTGKGYHIEIDECIPLSRDI